MTRLPHGVDVTAYRIVQEALTNALRHGHGGRAEVTIRYAGRYLRVEVLNSGPSVLTGDRSTSEPDPTGGGSGSGRGLLGLRERVAVYGGHLDARRRLGGGYRGPRPDPVGAPMTGPGPCVLVADDQVLVRTGFRMILAARGIDVVGEAADGQEAVDAARRLRPDVILMDIRMPRLDGLEATRRILPDDPDCRVIMLTTFDLDRYVSTVTSQC